METSLGDFLRSEREARGISLIEIAAETKVPEASLQSIEEDRLDDLPGEVFVRGFLRAYAQCLELDPEEVLSRLDRPAPTPTLPLIRSSKFVLRRRRIASPALLLVLLLAVALMALVLWRPMTAPSFSAHGNLPPPASGTTAG